ncbi:MlaD family protein [Falsiroseomonas selenitidurans]|uniref:MCE family protein n=1 Tax=Falsiroseomonas selenitidurans TaxID=2716335 RepID=A0ABX1E1G9_9PROT|nr:MlaD family protein [Falsiroseomonas selenitidurans]NKC31004.1 MCE family protein [Falsiroseomonas selenitidurans]
MGGARMLYARVGALVLVGIVLGVAFVLFLAGGRGLQANQVFESYFSESVQGLDVGAPVRYRGVAIGRVTQIGLVAAEYPRPAGAEYSANFARVFIRFAVDLQQVGETPDLDRAIELGLRSRITAQGITGVNYLELDFVQADRFPVQPPPWEPRNDVIPGVPSTVAQVTSAAELLIQRLADIPVDRITQDIAGILDNVNRQTGDGDLAQVLREAATTMALLRAAVQDSDLAGALGEFRAAATEARSLVSGPEIRGAITNAAGAAAELRRVAQTLPGAVEGMERTMRSARETTVDVQAELLPILIDLRATTANLRATAEQLRSSPTRYLFGAPPTPDRRR